MEDKTRFTALVIIISTMLILILVATFISFRSPYRVKENKKEKVDTFLYKGHTMVKFIDNKNISVCHSPECGKCTLFYD